MDHDGGLGARLRWLVDHHPTELAEILADAVPVDLLRQTITAQVSSSVADSDPSVRTRSPSTALPRRGPRQLR